MLESYLIAVGIKSTVLLAFGLICLRFLRGWDAAVRHMVCLAALASAITVPLFALWSPQWSFLISMPAGPGVDAVANRVGFAPWNWPIAVLILWVLGALGMTLRAAGGWLLLLRTRGGSRYFPYGDRAEVRMADVTTPFTCGVFRPLILLPLDATEWSAVRLRAVILHESAHVRRRDCLARYIAQASRALLWWNLLAWMSAARLYNEQELACDDAVLSAGVAPEDYARALLDTARECSSSLLLGCAMSGSSVLRARLEHLFVWRPEGRRATRRTALVIPLLLALMTCVSCAVKRYPQASILSGTHIVQYLPEARPRPHK